MTLDGRPDLGYLAAMTFERITIDPAVCTGKPCIRGLRFPVARLLGLLAAGETRETILGNYLTLSPKTLMRRCVTLPYLAEDETLELAR